MISVDTNILLRIIAKDDDKQLETVKKLFNSSLIYVLDTVWLETAWVLKSTYKFNEAEIVKAFSGLIESGRFKTRNIKQFKTVLQKITDGMDIADAFHAVLSGKKPFKTFDRKLVTAAKMDNVTLLK
jgi:predicted nucleic-acid-binding protein